MKFEKHLKNCGLFATIFRTTSGDLFLGCGAGARTIIRCPEGFVPMSAANVKTFPEHMEDILIDCVEELHDAELIAARLPKDGRASDIIRVFADTSRDRVCGIDQADFTLIERCDRVKIFSPMVDTGIVGENLDDLDEKDLTPVIVITNPAGTDVLGIILESSNAAIILK